MSIDASVSLVVNLFGGRSLQPGRYLVCFTTRGMMFDCCASVGLMASKMDCVALLSSCWRGSGAGVVSSSSKLNSCVLPWTCNLDLDLLLAWHRCELRLVLWLVYLVMSRTLSVLLNCVLFAWLAKQLPLVILLLIVCLVMIVLVNWVALVVVLSRFYITTRSNTANSFFTRFFLELSGLLLLATTIATTCSTS